MARYIDADEYKQRLADKDIFFPALFKIELNDMPTADVVPRSEVEKLEAYIDDLNDSKEHLAVMLEEARADVAREIFEEVETHIDDVGFCDFLERFSFKDYLAELKKKYTEGE